MDRHHNGFLKEENGAGNHPAPHFMLISQPSELDFIEAKKAFKDCEIMKKLISEIVQDERISSFPGLIDEAMSAVKDAGKIKNESKGDKSNYGKATMMIGKTRNMRMLATIPTELYIAAQINYRDKNFWKSKRNLKKYAEPFLTVDVNTI